jgi:tripartite-type tricarboxylate transporter receptor subunit TctC
MRKLLLLAATTAASIFVSAPARAEYPDRPITLLVNFAAGGGTDVAARMLAIPLSEALGRAVVVENRVGAGGNIGITAVSRAQPDGYTILVTSSAFVVNPSLSRQVTYDPINDFSPIVNVGVSPNVVVVRADSDMKTVADLIAKSKKTSLNYGSPGVGTTPHLAGEVLKQRTGIDMVHIPYAGGGPAAQAVLAGTTEVAVTNLSNAMGLLRDGVLRALVQTDKERWRDLQDVPTLAEAGIKDAETNIFIAFLAPGKTPKPIVDRLAKELAEISRRPEIVQRLAQLGVAAMQEGPDVLAARIVREVALYKQIIDTAGIAAK